MKIFIKVWAGLVIFTITILGAGIVLPVRAHAEDSLDLEIDESASMPWNVSGVIPGDSGQKVIELHNTGSLDGVVYIWISDIFNGEGANPESEEGNR